MGGGNTLLTAVVIITLTFLGLSLFLSNAIGYAVGIIFSFVMNSIFTFKKKVCPRNLLRFMLVCFICYIVNVVVMKIALASGVENYYVVQSLGMIFYTILSFFINKKWSMK
ncbi:TPA: GtrA family protein [Citrobacter braakii]|nr:GtrA family protein [Citrobacter sp. KTE151]